MNLTVKASAWYPSMQEFCNNVAKERKQLAKKQYPPES